MTTTVKPAVLIGWEQIAKYLDVDRRTAQRWAEQEVDPLPIGNHSRSKVHVAARSVELDAWLARHALEESSRRKVRPVVSGPESEPTKLP